MSERLLSLLPLPPIWEHKIRSVSYENTKKPALVLLHVCDSQYVCVYVCVRAPVALIVLPRQLDWKQTDKKHLKQKKRGGGGDAHTQQPVKSEMPLIFLSSASRLTRRERSAPTLLLQATRDRDGGRKRRGDGEEKDEGGKETDRASDMSFPYLKSLDSLNLSFLSRLWSFSLSYNRPLFPTSDSRRTKCIFVSIRGGRVIST